MTAGSPPESGDRLELKVGSKSLGLTTRDLLPVLMIVGLLLILGVMGYYRTKLLDSGLQDIMLGQSSLKEALHHQNLLLQSQTETLRTELRQQNVQQHQQTEYLRDLLETLNYNITRPLPEQLPIGRAPPKPPGGERIPPP